MELIENNSAIKYRKKSRLCVSASVLKEANRSREHLIMDAGLTNAPGSWILYKRVANARNVMQKRNSLSAPVDTVTSAVEGNDTGNFLVFDRRSDEIRSGMLV